MFRKLIVTACLFIASFNAAALEYTDVYFNPSEAGWGLFLVQSDTFQFAAFFIYGSDGSPRWYTAQMTADGAGGYAGTLYATTGTDIGAWDPARFTITSAGTVSFQPIDIYRANVVIAIGSSPAITKAVQRQTLTAYPMDGIYSGSMAGSISGCSVPAGNDPAFRARFVLDIAKVADESATLKFSFTDMNHQGLVCTASGPLTHLGRLYQMANATLVCTGPGQDGSPAAVTIDSFHPTGQGIEGRLKGNLGGGCTASLHFAAVLNVNN